MGESEKDGASSALATDHFRGSARQMDPQFLMSLNDAGSDVAASNKDRLPLIEGRP